MAIKPQRLYEPVIKNGQRKPFKVSLFAFLPLESMDIGGRIHIPSAEEASLPYGEYPLVLRRVLVTRPMDVEGVTYEEANNFLMQWYGVNSWS